MNECVHLEHFITSEDGLKTYNLLHGVFVISGSEERRQSKILNAFCYVCHSKDSFLHICMHCTFFACHEHIREHSRNLKHTFCMEMLYGQVHCIQCGDYIYSEEFDNVARENALQGDTLNKCVIELVAPGEHIDVNKEWAGKLNKMVIDNDTHIGLRGILNLGSTCFMNCVVQAMTHTPVLRDYFFTEAHNCGAPSNKCLITSLFRDFYTGEKAPLVLNEFLQLIWTEVRPLSGYRQQDAHEFFIHALDVFHKHCAGIPSTQVNYPISRASCSCIIDEVYSGSLQSDVVCQKCNGVSSTIEKVFDYSLDLMSSATDGSLPGSLEEILERFTVAEILGANSKIFCEKCQSYEESTKQFTMKTLPVVLSFHLKRFHHINDFKEKISAKIKFPELLDMTPFMTKQQNDNIFHIQCPYANKYLLFAVINHKGTSVNSGHYIAYIRYQDRYWYKCDDLVISEVEIDEVLQSEAYILFYHKYYLDYN